MLQVLGKSSSINVCKVLWTCDELGLPFEREVVLWESNPICRYLGQKTGRTDLLPADAAGRGTP